MPTEWFPRTRGAQLRRSIARFHTFQFTAPHTLNLLGRMTPTFATPLRVTPALKGLWTQPRVSRASARRPWVAANDPGKQIQCTATSNVHQQRLQQAPPQACRSPDEFLNRVRFPPDRTSGAFDIRHSAFVISHPTYCVINTSFPSASRNTPSKIGSPSRCCGDCKIFAPAPAIFSAIAITSSY